ncbi:toprim domain-containing protein [Mycoplasma sp. 1018B]|uniref:toprim domain-containing protein n=1 Tax=Mycoplasma sp. 1018B TaxID=2967302 RepID=UPI00211C02AF|nr:toprim domain-containing protein [Mycoplasma sp. 1018B]UUM19081.1 toprim domain-containing protein [Mycoplasma sp. 1018B]
MKINSIENLINKLTLFPGISKKQAEKMSNFLLIKDQNYLNDLINSFEQIKKRLSFCNDCNYIKEDNICLNCKNLTFNNEILMIVESIQAVNKLINNQIFSGIFYVMPYLIDAKMQANDNKTEFEHLINYLSKNKFKEVIIVLSPTLQGELTTNLLINKLNQENIKCSRAAIGMPINSNIDYLDPFTIKESIINRKNK